MFDSEKNNELYETDRKAFGDMTSGKPKANFDLSAFRRLVLSELSLSGCFDGEKGTLLGFTREEIARMTERPERFGRKILRLSGYMYLRSGYYKRLIDYFADQAVLAFTVDTKMLSPEMMNVPEKELLAGYVRFAALCDKLSLSSEIHNILKAVYKHDVCFAYLSETENEISYFYLDPSICTISSVINGNVFGFSINARALSKAKLAALPAGLRKLINERTDENGFAAVPPENSLCIKYNSDIPFVCPPFLTMIADILLIDEYKELAKAQSINDAYKILTMKIPTKDGEITLDEGLISAFTSVVLSTVQKNIGVVTTPFDMKTEEFSSSDADNRDTVSDAISWAFKNAGVSEALMSGASSGSELRLSVTNDSGDIFRIYRLLENWVSLQTKLRGCIGTTHEFVYRILDITTFNRDDVKKTELSLAQSGLPDKTRLCAASGISPAAMLGNSFMENTVMKEIFDGWAPLKVSYGIQAASGGRTETDDTLISESTEKNREYRGE